MRHICWGVLLVCVIGMGMTACGIAEGPRQKLTMATYHFNEGLRWGRYNDVFPVVDPEVLDSFKALHEGWGETLLESDAEILETVYDDKQHKAVVSVRFTWYRKSEMVVHSTVTRQHWEYKNSGWVMMAEEHLSGTPF